MLTGMTPDAGSQVTAQAQALTQRNIIIPPGTGDSRGLAVLFPADAEAPVNRIPAAIRTSTYFPTRGLPRVRVSLFQYPWYDRGDFTFPARNFLQWRIVAPFPGWRPTQTQSATDGEYTPVTTPQLLLTGQVISTVVPAGGLYAVAVEFSVGPSGTTQLNQGFDRVLVSISAA
jgi:hypothetical protein